jgi:hypothetical protein
MRKFLKKKKFIVALSSGAIVFVFFGLSFLKIPSFNYLYSNNNINNSNTEVKYKPTHIKAPDSVKGIYMTSYVAGTKKWRENLANLIDTTELNSVVIDIKDYTGRISYMPDDPELKAIGSYENRIPDIKDFINYLHLKNIYVIGRISVFQDPFLVKAHPELAVKNKAGSAVWKDKKGITWLSICSSRAWDYTIQIAKDAEYQGFDEINFDYIRFPSDGNMKDISYPFCGEPLNKSEEVKNFFIYLKAGLNGINIPLSVDLFGMTTTNTDDLNIGQVLEKAEPYFDYICPMVYPSHYPATYNGYKNPATHPYEVVKLAMNMASKRLLTASSTPAKLRPWLQDFNLGAIYDASMVRKQIQAVYDAGLNSWLLWDPANTYTTGALNK